jgi:23S rRNA G2069 N7-methylase RlmK/C1962 C5-methylase RlmI
MVSVEGCSFLIPPNSVFFISDFKLLKLWMKCTIDLILAYSIRFDLILADPPWFNASVSRGSKYNGMDCYDLLTIPISKALAPGGIFAIWVSNNEKYHKFVQSKLLRKFKMNIMAKIIWIKVTTKAN